MSVDSEAPRERTYGWTPCDPRVPPLQSMTGLEYHQGMLSGDIPLPSIGCTIGWRLTAVDRGAITLTLADCDHLLNGSGSLGGGAMSAMLDSSMASAVMTQLDRGTGCSTVSLNVQMLRAGRADRVPLRVEARSVTVGRNIATADARLLDCDGKALALATATCLVFALAV